MDVICKRSEMRLQRHLGIALLAAKLAQDNRSRVALSQGSLK